MLTKFEIILILICLIPGILFALYISPAITSVLEVFDCKSLKGYVEDSDQTISGNQESYSEWAAICNNIHMLVIYGHLPFLSIGIAAILHKIIRKLVLIK